MSPPHIQYPVNTNITNNANLNNMNLQNHSSTNTSTNTFLKLPLSNTPINTPFQYSKDPFLKLPRVDSNTNNLITTTQYSQLPPYSQNNPLYQQYTPQVVPQLSQYQTTTSTPPAIQLHQHTPTIIPSIDVSVRTTTPISSLISTPTSSTTPTAATTTTPAVVATPTIASTNLIGKSGKVLRNTKRAAQNRNAQKAFRLRREKYIKDLELKATKFDSLIIENNNLKKEIESLKQQLLKDDNKLSTSVKKEQSS
ncbi:hypothetical protein TBLA_0J00790 [Henningerozyma blattae CBS 6284]|uniref:BZIP domain-containing protein n=1 Tax=Henningerozyma blattae (strain ATCC 34711 / CBS 6284 / DSM 70876 / NBRC 10599 / NRRL Y-10934 / UCD 77-7) TaxID=1071380 RepID=I2H9M5_HENB6|nr:hypothetical protein TBLA_0J00790 [Tetrapisispora blattae CBS 6284]CCH63077.1 hypothetical protein TBLA_0J00790 [Tetrapisispora blattae CBS 6284]